MRIAHAARVADAIEKLQDLDGALAPRTERIAVMRGTDRAVLLRQGADNGRKLRDTAGVVEEILHDLVHTALHDELAQDLAYPLLGLTRARGQRTHPGRIEAPRCDQRLQSVRERAVRLPTASRYVRACAATVRCAR